ncbi:MAG: monovalent cation/H(+) antiporter subunit G [Chloroflexi bacterium]|nr:monovalent cation/H(+) antiporter subunit G [Chloroflexota bacterium]
MQIIGGALLLIGTFFVAVGVYGVVFKLTNVYERLHAAGKVATLGLVSILLGVALLQPAVWTKVVVLIGFMVLTSPAVSHAIANAAHDQHIPAGKRDDLDVSKREQ